MQEIPMFTFIRHSVLAVILVFTCILITDSPANAQGACNRPDPPPYCDHEPPEPPEPPENQNPRGALDSAVRQPGQVQVIGWAIDPDTTQPIWVTAYVDGVHVSSTVANQPHSRADVLNPGYGQFHGYDMVVPVSGRRLCVYASDYNTQTQDKAVLGCTSIDVDPFGQLDEVYRQPGTLRLRGWAIDPDIQEPVDIHIYVDDVFVGSIAANMSRPDVAASYPGYGDQHGFDTTITTTGKDVCAYAINQSLGTLNSLIGCSVDPMRGFADIHNHQFANLAFGGNAIVGEAFGPIANALSPSHDAENHGLAHRLDVVGSWLALRPNPLNIWSPGSPWGSPPLDVTLLIYPNDGYPGFGGWPQFYDVTHQKVYEDWLYRAVQGGLRLMVMFAVDSPKLCQSTRNDGRECENEMATIDRQINAAYRMQGYIDDKAGGPGQGWYRIVTTPAEARRVIQEGKLAVVLGIETAHLFSCDPEESPPSCYGTSGVRIYRNKGVSHFFIIHQGDSSFGGAAYFAPLVQRQTNWLGDQWKRPIATYDLYTIPCNQYDLGRCNAQGLTEDGRDMIEELMRSGALIDIDHMSGSASAATIAIAQQYQYPLVASHAGFNEINSGAQDHEGQLTSLELTQIQNLGGMVGLISGQGDLREVDTYQRPGGHTVRHVCGRSTETFAQAYYYAIDHAPGMPVAIGTDFNSPLAQPGPRFGANQCFGFLRPATPEVHPQNSGVNRDWMQEKSDQRLVYPFVARGSQIQLDKYVSGNRTFDFNTDGLAHVGLLPDFFADLEALGISAEDLEPLFYSAEGYVQMWERAINASRNVPGRLDGYTSPGTLVTGMVQNFTINAYKRYTQELVIADVYFNDIYIGTTGQATARTFSSQCQKIWHYEPETGGSYYEWQPKAPNIHVKLTAPGYIDARFDLNVEIGDDDPNSVSCGPARNVSRIVSQRQQ